MSCAQYCAVYFLHQFPSRQNRTRNFCNYNSLCNYNAVAEINFIVLKEYFPQSREGAKKCNVENHSKDDVEHKMLINVMTRRPSLTGEG